MIFLSDFSEQSFVHKVPSEIILDKDLECILAFGNECKSYIKTHEKNKYEYFKNIRMNLFKQNYFIESTNGKRAEKEIIISKILEIISKYALSQIQRTVNNSIKKEDIK